MRVCDLTTGLGRLAEAFSDLKERWEEVREVWRDEACKQFEEQHLKPIPRHVQQLVTATQQLSQAVDGAVQECDDRPE
jgi:hypothetical protein